MCSRPDGSYFYGRKSEDETEIVSSSDFYDSISDFITKLAKADCCICIAGRARRCNCLSFLRENTSALSAVVSALKKHFDLSESEKGYNLINDC